MKRLIFLFLLLPCTATAQLSATLPVAKGVYRMPYANGTEVEITRDHTNHGNNNPMNGNLGSRNRMDMIGRPPGDPHVLVAAGDGRIRLIEDTNTLWCPNDPGDDFTICDGIPNCCERDDPSCNSNCANNYVWIEHANGEWSKYSHPRTGSVAANNWNEGDLISAGQAIGIEGQVGFASGPHLHFEIAEPRQKKGSYDPSDLNDPNHPINADGFLKGDGETTNPNYSRENRVIFFCQLGLLLDDDVVDAIACDGQCGSDNLTIGGSVTDNNVAQQQVTSALTLDGQTVDAGGGMAVRGGTSVTILPGFQAENNSYFSASVAPCDSPG